MGTRTLMIHHIHGGPYPQTLGSIGLSELEKACQSNCLLTFDDGLACQSLAFPMLNYYQKHAIFFINNENKIERFRAIINSHPTVNEFYEWFWSQVGVHFKAPSHFLSEYSFYSQSDRDYRWFRDVMNPALHDTIMDIPVDEPLFLDPHRIAMEGFEIGLHSATHPRNMDQLPWRDQLKEWLRNIEYVEQYQPNIRYASYPMGRYNATTKDIMYLTGMEKAYSSSEHTLGQFEMPRTDIKKWLNEK